MKEKPQKKVLIKDLAFAISHSEGISLSKANRIIKKLIFFIIAEVCSGAEVNLESFCKIKGVYQAPRLGNHPRTHEKIQIKESVRIKMALSAIFKKQAQTNVDIFALIKELEDEEEMNNEETETETETETLNEEKTKNGETNE